MFNHSNGEAAAGCGWLLIICAGFFVYQAFKGKAPTVMLLIAAALLILGIAFAVAGARGMKKDKELQDALHKKFVESEVSATDEKHRSEYNQYEIKLAGVNKLGITDDMLGEFKGKMIADKANQYDSYAVAVLRKGKIIGYMPRDIPGRKKMKGIIKQNGGSIPVEGCIFKGTDGDRPFYYAGVNVLL